MPSTIVYPHKLNIELTRLRKDHTVPWLSPDSKAQVAIEYINGKPKSIISVVISTQHETYIKHKEIEHFLISEVSPNVLPNNLLTNDTEYFINPTDSFVTGALQQMLGSRVVSGLARHGGARFLAKTLLGWIVLLPIFAAGSQKISFQLALPTR